MTSLTTITRSPNSFQLRLAFNCRKSPSGFVRLHGRQLGYQFRVLSIVRDGANGNGAEHQGRTGNSWTNSNFSVDAFSGWSGDNGVEESSESQRKRWPGGIVGAGVAGVILVAGLTFAALSINWSTSGAKQKMEPLTTRQEESLASADQNDTIEEEGSEGKNSMLDDSSLESKTGIDKASSSNAENNDTTIINRLGHDTDVENGGEIMNNASVEREEELPTDDIQVDSVETPNLPESDFLSGPMVVSSFENSDGNPVAEKLELGNELKEDPTDAKITTSLVSDVNPTNLNTDYQEVVPATNEIENSYLPLDSSLSFIPDTPIEHVTLKVSLSSQLDAGLETQIAPKEDIETVSSFSGNEDFDLKKMEKFSGEENKSSPEVHNLNGGSSRTTSESTLSYPFSNEQNENGYNDNNKTTIFYSMNLGKFSSSASMPAPSVVSPALQALSGKVLVPAVVDQVQGQALAALQVLKVIEGDVQPGDLCTRREYARWLVSASSALSRNAVSKVYPAMYIENVTELAFDDVTHEDPDFSSIQGLAEAGLIASKLSRRDMSSSLDQDESPQCFCPESPLSRQDLVSWKMSVEKRLLPVADREILRQLSGFIDIDNINQDAWPALMADLSAGEQGIIGLAFGYTRLFQPDKPVTKAQAAIALATGESSDIVSEELARIEAETMAEKVVAAHSALVDQVEKDVNANFEKDLLMEREKINVVEKLAEETRQELGRLRAEREEENLALMKERAAVDSEMEALSRLRHELEEQLQSLMGNKVEISYEKERLRKLRKDTEIENQEITRLQYELEVERKALSMARAWAEEEAKRAREQAKILEVARDRWESQGIKVVVDNDLREEANAGVTWLGAGDQFSIEETKSRAEKLVDKLKAMAADVKGKARVTIDKVIQKILFLISVLKEWALEEGRKVGEVKDCAVSKVGGSLQDLQQSSGELSSAVKEGAKRVVGDCREGVEKLSQKFKT